MDMVNLRCPKGGGGTWTTGLTGLEFWGGALTLGPILVLRLGEQKIRLYS